MKIYELEVMALGYYTAIDFNDRSGCSDVDVDCWQEAVFTVAAESIEEAVKLIEKEYERLNRNYTNYCVTLCYNPEPLSVEEAEGDKAEILEYSFFEPREGDEKDAPARYSKEV